MPFEWYDANSGGRIHAVGELAANAFGLHDMHGNVWEFVQDWWEPAYTSRFPELIAVDPKGPASGVSRCVFRGGNWFYGATFARSASRHCNVRATSQDKIGFRLALTVAAVKQSIAERTASKPNASEMSWQGWPRDAPAPAIAPFISEQARKHQEEWAAYLDVPVESSNSIDMKFILIPPGEFQMGAIPEEYAAAIALARRLYGDNSFLQQHCESESPKHRVILTRPIYFGVNEVTQAQYEKVMGQNPSHFSANGGGRDAVTGLDTGNFPVETVSWFDAVEFCERLSRSEKRRPFYAQKGDSVTLIQGDGYRLPSEAEWEFSSRAGTTTRYWIGDDSSRVVQTAWCFHNSGGKLHATGELLPNPFGLHDMHGNVFEWTQDWWEPAYYQQFDAESATNPVGPPVAGVRRVVRGGFWGDDVTYCQETRRASDLPTEKNNRLGFRLVLAINTAMQR